MATVNTRPMTAEEFYDWANRPENAGRRWELERGEVVETPPPRDAHGTLLTWLGHLFWQFAARRGKGRVSADAGLLVERDPDTVRGPDLMFFDQSRRFDEVSPITTEDSPALAVEIRSPTDRWSGMLARVDQYLRLGVPLVWVIDPDDRTVTIFRPGQSHALFREDDELTGGEVLPDFRCRVKELFTLPGSA